jgi:hypothetical protein
MRSAPASCQVISRLISRCVKLLAFRVIGLTLLKFIALLSSGGAEPKAFYDE